jgi:hypothetical protein
LVGLPIKLLLVLASTVIPGFSLLEIHKKDFCYSRHVYVLKFGLLFDKGGIGLSV